jgi:hypothetical protein
MKIVRAWCSVANAQVHLDRDCGSQTQRERVLTENHTFERVERESGKERQ